MRYFYNVAADFAFPNLIFTCHYNLDQGNKLNKQERIEMWDEAHRKTIGWLFENDHLLLK